MQTNGGVNMTHKDALAARKETLAVVGLGYVGLPLAAAFAEVFDVIGFDLNAQKIALYRSGRDATHEVGDAAVAASGVRFTADETMLRQARFLIVAVPTPINLDKRPISLPSSARARSSGAIWPPVPSSSMNRRSIPV